MKQKPTTGTVQDKKATPSGEITSAGYPGSKHSDGVYHKIINQITPHDVFVSGTLGTDAVMSRKKPARVNIGVDSNLPAVQQYWTSLDRKDIKFVQAKFVDYISQFNFSAHMTERWFIYLDPPYLLSTRQGRLYYEHEMTEEDHQALIECVKTITALSGGRVHIAISHLPCELYDTLLNEGWRRVDYTVRWHRKTTTESLYCNYPEPEELHEYTYIGENRTLRQGNKRMVKNIVEKLNRLPALRRNAILYEVQQVYTTPPIKRK